MGNWGACYPLRPLVMRYWPSGESFSETIPPVVRKRVVPSRTMAPRGNGVSSELSSPGGAFGSAGPSMMIIFAVMSASPCGGSALRIGPSL